MLSLSSVPPPTIRDAGVGNAACNDGVLFFLSRDDRQLFISAGEGARQVLTDDHLDAVIQRARPLLRQQLLGAAVLQAVTDMGDALRAGPEGQSVLSEPVRQMREARQRAAKKKGGDGWMFMLYLSVFAAVFGYGKWRESKQKARLVGWQAARARLLEIDRLQAEAAAAAAQAAAQTGAQAGGGGTIRGPVVDLLRSGAVVQTDGSGSAVVRDDAAGAGGGAGAAAGGGAGGAVFGAVLAGPGSGSGQETEERARERERSLQRRRNAKDAGAASASASASGAAPAPASDLERGGRPEAGPRDGDHDDDGCGDHGDDGRPGRGGGGGAILASTGAASASVSSPAASSAAGATSVTSVSGSSAAPTPLAAQMACCPICLDDLPAGPGVLSSAVDAARAGNEDSSSAAASPSAAAASGATASNEGAAGGSAFGAGTAVTLACRHRFHLGCLDEWFGGQRRTRCPICRTTAYTADGRLPTDAEIAEDRRRGADGAADADADGGAAGGAGFQFRPARRFHHFHNYGNYGGFGNAGGYGYTAEGLHAMRPLGPDRMDGGATGGLAAAAPLHDNRADVDFLLQRLQARYPEYVPERLVTGWRQQAGLTAAGAVDSAATAPAVGGAGARAPAEATAAAGPRVGELASDPAFLAAMPAPRAEPAARSWTSSSRSSWSGGFRSGGSFGGGSSSGGRGGGW